MDLIILILCTATGPVEHINDPTAHTTCIGSTDKGAALAVTSDDQHWVKPTDPVLLEKCDSPLVYPMKSKPHGIAILINIDVFDPSWPNLDQRIGSKKDIENLQRLFDNLGYIIKIPTQLSRVDILSELRNVAMKIDHSTYDSLVVSLMSHGEDDYIFCSDGQKLAINDVRAIFSNENCTALAGKPKLFFVQACRGKQRDRGMVCQDSPDANSTDEPSVKGEVSIKEEKGTLKFDLLKETFATASDVLLAFSSVSGHASFRNTANGSRFIRTLVEVFREYAGKEDLLSMLTIVNNEVSKLGDIGDKQIPEPLTTLRKKVYFWPGLK